MREGVVSATPIPGSANGDFERLYVWELPVRLTHWLIFLSVLVLAATGFYIGRPFIAVPGAARDHFVMGTVRVVHCYAAIVFTLSVLVRVYWMFAGNVYARLAQLIPVTRARLRNLWQAVLVYSYIRRDLEPYPGHNALAGVSFIVIFAINFIMIATGLALYTVYASIDSPFQAFGFLIPVFGGLRIARLIHHIGMWLLLVFMVLHVYLVLLTSLTERNGTFDSMFSGYKFFPRRMPGE